LHINRLQGLLFFWVAIWVAVFREFVSSSNT